MALAVGRNGDCHVSHTSFRRLGCSLCPAPSENPLRALACRCEADRLCTGSAQRLMGQMRLP